MFGTFVDPSQQSKVDDNINMENLLNTLSLAAEEYPNLKHVFADALVRSTIARVADCACRTELTVDYRISRCGELRETLNTSEQSTFLAMCLAKSPPIGVVATRMYQYFHQFLYDVTLQSPDYALKTLTEIQEEMRCLINDVTNQVSANPYTRRDILDRTEIEDHQYVLPSDLAKSGSGLMSTITKKIGEV